MAHDFDDDLVKFSFEGEKGISDELLEKYGKTYKKNQLIIKEGENSNDVYLIYQGSCFVTKLIGNVYKVLNIIKIGELFGEMAVFDETKRSATIIAREDNTICLKFPKNDFIEIIKIHPRWIDKIISEMSLRIVKMINKL